MLEEVTKACGRFLENYTDTGRNLVNIFAAGTLFSKSHSVLDRLKIYILGDSDKSSTAVYGKKMLESIKC